MTAENTRAALEISDKENFDLVIVDLSMPEMDGLALAQVIRRRWPNTCILLATGYGKTMTPSPDEQGLVNGIIAKPFDFDQIIKAAEKLYVHR